MTSFPMEQTEITALHMNPARALTNRAKFLRLKLPQIERGVTVALSRPHREQKSGFSCSCHLRTPEGYGYISARRRPVSVRTGGFFRAGERSLAFFCTL